MVADAGGVCLASLPKNKMKLGLQATIHAQSGSFSTQMLNARLSATLIKNAHVYLGAAELKTAWVLNAQNYRC